MPSLSNLQVENCGAFSPPAKAFGSACPFWIILRELSYLKVKSWAKVCLEINNMINKAICFRQYGLVETPATDISFRSCGLVGTLSTDKRFDNFSKVVKSSFCNKIMGKIFLNISIFWAKAIFKFASGS